MNYTHGLYGGVGIRLSHETSFASKGALLCTQTKRIAYAQSGKIFLWWLSAIGFIMEDKHISAGKLSKNRASVFLSSVMIWKDITDEFWKRKKKVFGLKAAYMNGYEWVYTNKNNPIGKHKEQYHFMVTVDAVILFIFLKR